MRTKNTLTYIDEFVKNTNPDCIDTLHNLFRGWMESDLVDNLNKFERANHYYDFERITELLNAVFEDASE